MPRPLVAVVGRPNVGKSTLFNRLVGRRVAIVEDTPGITRDRLYHNVEWNGIEFTVNRVGATLFGFETIAGFSGRAKLDRTQFGMTAFPKAVGTEVTVRLEIEAKLDRQAQYEYQQAVDKAHAAAQH